MSAVKSLLVTVLAFGFIFLMGCSEDDNDLTLTPDTSAPVISNISHSDADTIIGNRTITFTVDVTDDIGAAVTITHNGNPVTVTASGDTYTVGITLEDRTNNTIVVSANDADNTTTESITLNYPFLAFTNGQEASVVIGQDNFSSTQFNRGASRDSNTLFRPNGLVVVNDVLYIADNSNHRVLGFNSIPTAEDGDLYADFVIGQSSTTVSIKGTAADQLSYPSVLSSDGTNLFIGIDKHISIIGGAYSSSAARIHRWNTAPLSNVYADNVIGQLEFEPVTDLSGCLDNSFNFNLTGMHQIDGKILVTDRNNHRILIWNSVPTENGVAADMVLGQNTFVDCEPNDINNDGVEEVTASTLNVPGSIWSDGEKLVVADTSNNRILIWNSFPTSSGQPADVVLGQNDNSSNTPPSEVNGTSFTPYAVVSNGNQLFVSDHSAKRVLVWDSFPSSNQPADRVLGKPTLTTTTNLFGASALSDVKGLFIYNNKLLVSDTNNNRVLFFEAP